VRAPAAPEPPAAPQPAAAEAGGTAAADPLADQLAERTADLQRLQAEYTNYRRRVERDREAVREQAVAAVLVNLLPVLDDIGRARAHGELDGGFKAVAEALEATVDKLGLQAYGAEGDPFDPVVHEALTHGYSDDVTEPTAVTVFQVGYRIGNRIVRPARVGVAEPEESGAPAQTAADGETQAE
jgi:molecular chaperone GrpE